MLCRLREFDTLNVPRPTHLAAVLRGMERARSRLLPSASEGTGGGRPRRARPPPRARKIALLQRWLIRNSLQIGADVKAALHLREGECLSMLVKRFVADVLDGTDSRCANAQQYKRRELRGWIPPSVLCFDYANNCSAIAVVVSRSRPYKTLWDAIRLPGSGPGRFPGFHSGCLASDVGLELAYRRQCTRNRKKVEAHFPNMVPWLEEIEAHLDLVAAWPPGAARGEEFSEVRGKMLCVHLLAGQKSMAAQPTYSYGIEVVWPAKQPCIINNLLRALLAVRR
jgi:hypothetical protein